MTAITAKAFLLVPVLLFFLGLPIGVGEAQAAGLKLASPAFSNGGAIPAPFTCAGIDVNPPLVLSRVPKGTRSLALVVDDPDAPGEVWVHWLIWNIDPATRRIERHSLPSGAIQGVNGWQSLRYRGPCPPSGTHHYYFRLYALSEPVNLAAGASRSDLERAMQGKIIDSSQLMGTYTHK